MFSTTRLPPEDEVRITVDAWLSMDLRRNNIDIPTEHLNRWVDDIANSFIGWMNANRQIDWLEAVRPDWLTWESWLLGWIEHIYSHTNKTQFWEAED